MMQPAPNDAKTTSTSHATAFVVGLATTDEVLVERLRHAAREAGVELEIVKAASPPAELRSGLRAALSHLADGDASAPSGTFAAMGNVGLRDIERDLILRAYEESGKNLSRAARKLSIPRTTLRDKIRRYGSR